MDLIYIEIRFVSAFFQWSSKSLIRVSPFLSLIKVDTVGFLAWRIFGLVE